MKTDTVYTQIRIPAEFHSQISEIAKRDGISINAAILTLVRMGIKVYESPCVVRVES